MFEESSYLENVVALCVSAKAGPKTAEEAKRETASCNQRAQRSKRARDRQHAERMAEIERYTSIALEILQSKRL